MADKREKRGLGRGLSALMADVAPAAPDPATPAQDRGEQRVPIDRIRPNPDQPRRRFDDAALKDLANSIREKGIIQPLILRADPSGADRYQIVAGERRWRAAQIAQLHEVPAIIRTLDDLEVLEVAIIENIQRADLDPVEEAQGYRQLMDSFGHTQEKLAEALGKSRSHIANMLRLLTLPAEVQDLLVSGRITAGHARALVGSDRAVEIAREVAAKGLSVRDVERLMKKAPAALKPVRGDAPSKDADTRLLERDLAAALGLGVTIDHRPGDEGGRLTLRYKSLDQLDDICRRLASERG